MELWERKCWASQLRRCVKTTWPKTKLWRKRFIHLILTDHCPSLEELRTGAQAGLKDKSQELTWRLQRGAAYWLASSCLLSLQFYRTQEYQTRWAGPSHFGHWLKIMPYIWVSWRHFLKLRLLSLWWLLLVLRWHWKECRKGKLHPENIAWGKSLYSVQKQNITMFLIWILGIDVYVFMWLFMFEIIWIVLFLKKE